MTDISPTPPLVYLDSNVLVDMCDGRLPELKSAVIKASEEERATFPFTADMVAEIALNIKSKEEVMQRLLFLTVISKELYFERTASAFQFVRRDAFQVHDTLTSVTTGVNAAALFRSLVPYETHKSTAEAYGMDPVIMNNLPPDRLFEYIEKKLREYQYPEGSKDDAPRTIEDTLNLIETMWRNANKEFWDKHALDSEKMMRGFKHSTLFTLLDSYGYCRDQQRAYEKGSAFADSSHTFLASYCDMLVSSDVRMRKRAEAVFWYLNHSTQALAPSELLETLGSG